MQLQIELEPIVEVQQQQVLQHLVTGKTITNREAFFKFEITRLGDVIFRLRRKGHLIKTELVPNQRNNAKHAKYQIIQ